NFICLETTRVICALRRENKKSNYHPGIDLSASTRSGSPASQPRTPAIKSSNGVGSPRLQCKHKSRRRLQKRLATGFELFLPGGLLRLAWGEPQVGNACRSLGEFNEVRKIPADRHRPAQRLFPSALLSGGAARSTRGVGEPPHRSLPPGPPAYHLGSPGI